MADESMAKRPADEGTRTEDLDKLHRRHGRILSGSIHEGIGLEERRGGRVRCVGEEGFQGPEDPRFHSDACVHWQEAASA